MSDLEVTDVDATLPDDLTRPVSMRWTPGILARADAIAAAAGPGWTRSLVLRMACENGLPIVERALSAMGTSADA